MRPVVKANNLSVFSAKRGRTAVTKLGREALIASEGREAQNIRAVCPSTDETTEGVVAYSYRSTQNRGRSHCHDNFSVGDR